MFKNKRKNIGQSLRSYFVAGSLIVLPVLLTLFLFIWFFKFLDSILGRFINRYLMNNYGYSIPGLGIIFSFLLILFTGFLVTHLINKRVLGFLEYWFVKFPVIRQIYPAVKQIVYFLFKDAKASFRKTVLVEFPRKGLYSLGFVTNESPDHFNKKTKRRLFNVFIPSTPGPLTGYLVIVPYEDLIMVDISIEDALKMIISGGVVQPARESPSAS